MAKTVDAIDTHLAAPRSIRGTGTLGGTAQGAAEENDDATEIVDDDTGEERVKGLTEVAAANRLERGDVDVRP